MIHSLQSRIDKIIRKIFKSQHPLLAELLLNWSKIVGPKIAQHSYPMKITTTFNANKQRINLLHIAVTDSAVIVELSYQQDIILERIAIYLGYKAVHKCKIIVR